MKVKASFNKVVTAEEAKRLIGVAAEVKPVYPVVPADDEIGVLTAMRQELANGRTGDFAIHHYWVCEDGTFVLALCYHSGKSGNVESIQVYIDIDYITLECRFTIDIDCETTRGAFRERVRPVLEKFGVHPKEFELRILETSAGAEQDDRRGMLMPWYMTKGEYAVALVENRIDGISAAEQIQFVTELIKEATDAEREAQFVEDNYPNWVKEFRSGLDGKVLFVPSMELITDDLFTPGTNSELS